VYGVGVRCLEAGCDDDPIVLLHGGRADAAGFSFRDVIPSLARSHRVFGLEWPGFGLSDPMPPVWKLADLMPFLPAALDELGLERVTLVGLSLGGAVALGFLLHWPTRVERLVLADSYGLGASVEDSYGRVGALGTRLFLGVPGLNALTSGSRNI
jgi:pimeloyl-ACP methyl ester carboxylesterase